MQTIEQTRADYASRMVQAVLNAPNQAVAGHYRSYARQFGALIHTNGLGQALAFALSKGSGGTDPKALAWHALHRHFSDWLTGQGAAPATAPKPLATPARRGLAANAPTDALRGITQGSVADYMLATAEAMALAAWFKRLAEARIPARAIAAAATAAADAATGAPADVQAGAPAPGRAAP